MNENRPFNCPHCSFSSHRSQLDVNWHVRDEHPAAWAAYTGGLDAKEEVIADCEASRKDYFRRLAIRNVTPADIAAWRRERHRERRGYCRVCGEHGHDSWTPVDGAMTWGAHSSSKHHGEAK